MLQRLVDRLIERSKRTPYYHLYHRDTTPYMLRYWLMPERFLEAGNADESPVDAGLSQEKQVGWWKLRADVRHLPAARLHNICTSDLDREMHNHPWSFVSIILRGGYTERRPLNRDPSFHFSGVTADRRALIREERGYIVHRKVGDVAFRSYNDRHRIVHVEPDTWTLILMGPKRQTWGFFTEDGFVNWHEFSSAHNTEPV